MIGAETAGDERTANGSVWLMLGGAGLTIYGLTRGGWTGLALAAAGGLLVVRGLRGPARRNSQPPAVEIPPADSPNADRFLRDALENQPSAAARMRPTVG